MILVREHKEVFRHLKGELDDVTLEIGSDEVPWFVENSCLFGQGMSDFVCNTKHRFIVRVRVVPGEDRLYSNVLLLRKVFNAEVVLCLDANRMNEHTVAELFYIEDCLHHSIRMFTDTSWLRVEFPERPNPFELLISHIKERHGL